MSEIKLGVTLPQFTDDPDRFVDAAYRAEELGLDSLWVFDHVWPLTGKRDRPMLECWTGLAWLAASTDRIGVGTLVTRSSLRHPPILAKMAATVATIAQGRVTIGLGSGDHMNRDENDAFGLPYFAGESRYEQFARTLKTLRSYVHSEVVELPADGRLPASPRVAAPPPVWAAGRSQEMLSIAGSLADGWNGWGGDASDFARDAAVVRAAASNRSVELTWAGGVVIGRDDGLANDRLGKRNPAEWLVGGPATIAARLAGFVEAGATHLICTFPDAGDPEAFELAAQVRGRLKG